MRRNSSTPTLNELIGMMLCQLGSEVPRNRIYISASQEEVYNFFYELQQEFASDFPGLNEAHFYTGGAHWHSVELYHELWLLFETGKVSTDVSNGYHPVVWHPDSQEHLDRMKELYFGNNKEKRARFAELVERCKKIIKEEEYVVTADLPF